MWVFTALGWGLVLYVGAVVGVMLLEAACIKWAMRINSRRGAPKKSWLIRVFYGAVRRSRHEARRREAKYDAQGWHPCPCPGSCGECDNGRIWRN